MSGSAFRCHIIFLFSQDVVLTSAVSPAHSCFWKLEPKCMYRTCTFCKAWSISSYWLKLLSDSSYLAWALTASPHAPMSPPQKTNHNGHSFQITWPPTVFTFNWGFNWWFNPWIFQEGRGLPPFPPQTPPHLEICGCILCNGQSCEQKILLHGGMAGCHSCIWWYAQSIIMAQVELNKSQVELKNKCLHC